MCTSRGCSRNADPGAERLHRLADVEAALAAEHPNDLVVEVVVPRRASGWDVPHEHRGAGRPVVRPVQHLEGARTGRLAGLDVLERDHRLQAAHRRVEVGRGAERRPHASESLRSRIQRAGAPRGEEARRPAGECRIVESSRSRVGEDERVVKRVGEVERRPGLEAEGVERELGAALRRDERVTLDPLGDDRVAVGDACHAAHGESIGSARTSRGTSERRRPCR